MAMNVFRIDSIDDPYARLAAAILRRAYLDAGPHNKSALCFLYEDETAWLMDSIGLDVEATRERMTRCLMRRTLRRQARGIDKPQFMV